MSGSPMSREEFTDELEELIAAGRDGGLSDEGMIMLLEAGDQGATRGPVAASASRISGGSRHRTALVALSCAHRCR